MNNGSVLRRPAIQIYQYNIVVYKIHNIIDKDPIQTHGIVLGVYVKSSLSTCKEELKFNKYLSLYYLLVIIWQLKRNPREKRRESRQHQLRGLEPLRRGRYPKHEVRESQAIGAPVSLVQKKVPDGQRKPPGVVERSHVKSDRLD
jgi:hypothetical protein